MWYIYWAHITFNFHCIERSDVNRFVVHVWKCWNTQQNMNELHLLHKSFCTCLMWNCMSPIVKYKVIENTFEMKRRKSQRKNSSIYACIFPILRQHAISSYILQILFIQPTFISLHFKIGHALHTLITQSVQKHKSGKQFGYILFKYVIWKISTYSLGYAY